MKDERDERIVPGYTDRGGVPPTGVVPERDRAAKHPNHAPVGSPDGSNPRRADDAATDENSSTNR